MRIPSMAAACLLISTAAAGALADDRVMPVTDPLVRKECGGCHMAFSPALLPARSWDRLMSGLADHFGEDASLPAAQVATIRTYLTANAADVAGGKMGRKFLRGVAEDAVPLRITSTPAFVREHNFPDRVWRDPKVLTKSNCLACHAGADQGWFDDD